MLAISKANSQVEFLAAGGGSVQPWLDGAIASEIKSKLAQPGGGMLGDSP